MQDFSELDPGTFWRVLGSRAVGMTLVTSGQGENRAGLIALSAAHVSAAPPTLLASIEGSTSALATIRDTGAFAINFLASIDRPVHDRFHPKSGIKGAERFEDTHWGQLKTGSGLTGLTWLRGRVSERTSPGCGWRRRSRGR